MRHDLTSKDITDIKQYIATKWEEVASSSIYRRGRRSLWVGVGRPEYRVTFTPFDGHTHGKMCINYLGKDLEEAVLVYNNS